MESIVSSKYVAESCMFGAFMSVEVKQDDILDWTFRQRGYWSRMNVVEEVRPYMTGLVFLRRT